MKLNYNHKTNRFSLCNLTEDEANAILRSLSIVVEKMDYNEELGFYTDNGTVSLCQLKAMRRQKDCLIN